MHKSDVRVLRFPEKFAVGKVFALIDGQETFLAEAKGAVALPDHQAIQLDVKRKYLADLTFLNNIGPDDLTSLAIKHTVRDEQLSPVCHLSGLRALDLSHTYVTPAGLNSLATLTKLKYLNLQFTDCSLDIDTIKALSKYASLEEIDLGLLGLPSRGHTCSTKEFEELNSCLAMLKSNLPKLQKINYGFLKTAQKWKKLAQELDLQFFLRAGTTSSDTAPKEISFQGLEKSLENPFDNWDNREPEITKQVGNCLITLSACVDNYEYHELYMGFKARYESKTPFSLSIRKRLDPGGRVPVVSNIWNLLFGTHDIETGYPELDSKLVVNSPQKHLVYELLKNSEIRSGLEKITERRWGLWIGKSFSGEQLICLARCPYRFEEMEQLTKDTVQIGIDLMENLITEFVKLNIAENSLTST